MKNIGNNAVQNLSEFDVLIQAISMNDVDQRFINICIKLIKLLPLFLYNVLNNAHHCACFKVQSEGFFYLKRK